MIHKNIKETKTKKKVNVPNIIGHGHLCRHRKEYNQ